MTPDELLAAVRARLDEWEQAAERVRSYPARRWEYANSDYGPTVKTGAGVWRLDCNVQVWQCDDEADGCPDEAREWRAEGRWIAAHDPVSVLRQVEGYRRVLARHTPFKEESDPITGCAVCSWRDQFEERLQVEWPCDDILGLAFGLGIDTEETDDA